MSTDGTACKGWRQYAATKPPTCLGGVGCDRRWEKYNRRRQGLPIKVLRTPAKK